MGSQSSGLLEVALGIKPGHEAILDFMRIGKDVALVELQNIGKVVYAGHKAVDRARLDHMLPFLPKKILVEHAL